MRVIEVDVHDDRMVRAWWELEQAAHHHDRSAPVLRTYDALTSAWRHPGPHYRPDPLAALAGDRVVGVADLGYSVGDNEHLADLEICVSPAHRRRGIGRALHDAATVRRREQGRTSALGEVSSPIAGDSPGLAFAEAMGCSEAHVEHHLVLDLPTRDRPPLAAGPTGYEIVAWQGTCPDELVEDYCRMLTRMEHDVPLGEVDHEPVTMTVERLRLGEQRAARSYDVLVAAARRTADGAPAGYTKTYLARGTDQALQDDTLVMPDHRGQRLGRVLKQATLALVERDHPERRSYHTWTDPDNHAMYRTNRAFGYRPVEVQREMQVKD